MGKTKQNKYLWLKVSNDEYELPEYVADSARELAEKYGVTESTIIVSVMRQKNNSSMKSHYRRVKVGD